MSLYKSIRKLASKLRLKYAGYEYDALFGEFDSPAKAKSYFIDMLKKLCRDTFQKWGVVRIEHQSGNIGFIGKDVYRIEFQDKIIEHTSLLEFTLEDLDKSLEGTPTNKKWDKSLSFSLKSLDSRTPEVTGKCGPTKQDILRSINKVLLPQLDKLFLKGRAKYMRENPDEFSHVRGELILTESGESGDLTLL